MPRNQRLSGQSEWIILVNRVAVGVGEAVQGDARLDVTQNSVLIDEAADGGQVITGAHVAEPVGIGGNAITSAIEKLRGCGDRIEANRFAVGAVAESLDDISVNVGEGRGGTAMVVMVGGEGGIGFLTDETEAIDVAGNGAVRGGFDQDLAEAGVGIDDVIGRARRGGNVRPAVFGIVAIGEASCVDEPVAGVVDEGRDRAAGDGGSDEVAVVVVNGGVLVDGGKAVIGIHRQGEVRRMVDARRGRNVFAGDFAVGIKDVMDGVDGILAREIGALGNLPGGIIGESFDALVRAGDGGDPAVGIVSIGGDPAGPVGHRGEAARGVVAVSDLFLVGISEGGEIAGAVVGVLQDLARRVGELGQPAQEIGTGV